MINIFLYSLVKLRIVLYSLVFKHYNKYNTFLFYIYRNTNKILINKNLKKYLITKKYI